MIVAIASRALFDLDESHQIFEVQGAEVYARYQMEHEEIPLAPGVAFPLVCKLLALNNVSLATVELAHVDTSFVYQGDGNIRWMCFIA